MPAQQAVPQDQLGVLQKAWNDVRNGDQGQLAPKVVHIQAESGVGKTYLLQQFYDTLAHEESYFTPGLTPRDIPRRADLDETRRQLIHPDRLQPKNRLDWLWLGIRCIPTTQGVTALGGGSQVGQVVDQITFHTAYIQAQRELRGAILNAAATSLIRLSSSLFPPIAITKEIVEGTKTASEVWSNWRNLRTREEDPIEDLADSKRKTAIRLLKPIDQLPVCIVVDDAHQASDQLVDLLAALLRADPEKNLTTGRFFDPGEPGATRRLIAVVASWPSALPNTPMEQWLNELETNTPMLWNQTAPLPKLGRVEAKVMVKVNLPWLNTGRVDALLNHLTLNRHMNPLAVVDALARINETFPAKDPDQVTDEFIQALPQTPYEASKQRFEVLKPPARAAVVLAAGIGYEFPPIIPINLLRGPGKLANFDYPTFHEVCDPHRYCLVAEPASGTPLEVWEFADDQTFYYARQQLKSAGYGWVRNLLPNGYTYFEDLAKYLQADLATDGRDTRTLQQLSLSRLGSLVGPAAGALLRATDLANKPLLKRFLQVLYQASQPRYLRDQQLLQQLPGELDGPADPSPEEPGDLASFMSLWLKWSVPLLVLDSPSPVSRASTLIDQAMEVAPRSSLTVQIAMTLVKEGDQKDRDKAAEALWSNRHCLQAALALAPHLAKTDRERLPELLGSHTRSSVQAALDLVGKYYWPEGEKHKKRSPDRSAILKPVLPLLEPHAKYSSEAASKLANVYGELGEFERQFETLGLWSGVDAKMTGQYVRALRKRGRLSEAQRVAEANVELFPGDFLLALEWTLLAGTDEARAHLHAVVDPGNFAFRKQLTYQAFNPDEVSRVIGEERLLGYLHFLVDYTPEKDTNPNKLEMWKVRGLAALIGAHLLRQQTLPQHVREKLWTKVAIPGGGYDASGLAELALARAEEPSQFNSWSITTDELRKIAASLAKFAETHVNSARQLGRLALTLKDAGLADQAYGYLLNLLSGESFGDDKKATLGELHAYLQKDDNLKFNQDTQAVEPDGEINRWRLQKGT